MEPNISIILPTYNGVRYIERAILSVLAQEYDSWELLIIADGSTDTTSEIVEKYIAKDSRIRFIQNGKNLGLQKTLNIGLREAKGKYIARIDDDDEWIDTKKLSLQIAYVNENQDCVLVGTGAIIVNETGEETARYLMPESDTEIRKYVLARNCFVHSSVLFKKEAAVKVGNYSEDVSVKHVEDYDLWLKLGAQGTFANIPIFGIKFLLAEHNISSKNMIEQYRKNIALSKKYKNAYPNYYFGICIAYARYIGALLFGKILPPVLRGKIIALYKNLLK